MGRFMILFLRNWCEQIVISIFISIIIEMLIPAGNIKKYVKVVVGVYIMFVILNPIISNIQNIDFENIGSLFLN